jgi:hypothetical protein
MLGNNIIPDLFETHALIARDTLHWVLRPQKRLFAVLA